MSLSVDICIYKIENKKDKFMRGKGFGKRKLHFGPIFGRAPCHAPWQLGGRNLWSPETVTSSKVSWLFYLFRKTIWDLDTEYAAASIWWLAVVIDFWGIFDNSLGRSFFSQKSRLPKAAEIWYDLFFPRRLTVPRLLAHCICIRSLQHRWRRCCSRRRWCF